MNAPATQTNLAAMRQSQAAQREAQMPAVRVGFFDLQGFELLQRVAKAFATSTLVPVQYQGNISNCMIALNLSERLHADALMVMQNLYIVHGNPGWSSKFLIASVNTCGRYESLRYEWRGEEGLPSFGCRAWTIERSTGEKLHGIWVDWKMVRAEGWDAKKGSKWLTMPDQMFIYRAAAFWQRAYAPEISMGLSTVEEMQDTFDARRGSDGAYSVDLESLRAADEPAAKTATVDTSTGEISDPDDDALAQLEQQQAQTVQQSVKQSDTAPADERRPNPAELEAIREQEAEAAAAAQSTATRARRDRPGMNLE